MLKFGRRWVLCFNPHVRLLHTFDLLLCLQRLSHAGIYWIRFDFFQTIPVIFACEQLAGRTGGRTPTCPRLVFAVAGAPRSPFMFGGAAVRAKAVIWG